MNQLKLGACLLMLAFLAPTTAYAAPSSWLKPGEPTFKHIRDVPVAEIPPYRNSDCLDNTKFVTTPRNDALRQPEASTTSCATQTSFGSVGNNGLLQRYGDNIGGAIQTTYGTNLSTRPIPNSDSILISTSGYDGSFLYVIDNFASFLKRQFASNGSIVHRLQSSPVEKPIKNSAGHYISFYSSRFSENGRWMIGEVPYVGMTRVNIETGETLVFGGAYNHGNGIRPQFVSAISSDGRYAVVAEDRYTIFKLYDLDTCAPTNDTTKMTACSSRNLLPMAQNQIQGFVRARHIQFSTPNTIRAHIDYGDDKHGLFTVTANGETESALSYLALGDSFASGEGAYSYKPYTDVRSPLNACHLSLVSYPYLLGLGKTESVACSGAHMNHLTENGSHQAEGKQDSGDNQSIYDNFSAGYRPQVEFVKRTKPTDVTLSIGGNDIGFGGIILACIAPGTCYKDANDRANLAYTIRTQQPELAKTYQTVKNSAASGAKIRVLGYPSLVDPEGNCAVNVRLNKTELTFANLVVNYLNQIIQAATQQAGVEYADVEQAFQGHRLCETKSSNVAVNGVTAGDDKTFTIPLKLIKRSADVYLTGRESYHPNQLGHQLYANSLAGATVSQNSNRIVTAAASLTDGLPTTQPKLLRFDETITNNILLRGAENEIKVTSLQPTKNAYAQLKSDSASADIPLSAYTVGSGGVLHTNLQIPVTTPPGIYTLAIDSFDQAGQPIIVQKTVYVAASADDIDGNGIANSSEGCLYVSASGQDSDKDGIDDACDNFIGDAPPVNQGTQINGGGSKLFRTALSSLSVLTARLVQAQSELQSDEFSPTEVLNSRDNNPAKTQNPETAKSSLEQRSQKPFWPLIIVIVLTTSGTIAYRRWHKRA